MVMAYVDVVNHAEIAFFDFRTWVTPYVLCDRKWATNPALSAVGHQADE